MGRIGASLSGIERTLLNRLHDANSAASVNLLRLATGKKINSPADNPSDFVTVSRFRGDLRAVKDTLTNVTTASQIVAGAQLSVDLIRNQLDTIRTLLIADEDGALTASERAANQQEIDAAIAKIDRLATAPTGGRRVLDGSADFRVSGGNSSQIVQVDVHARSGAEVDVISGSVDSAATQATLVYTGTSAQITDDATFTLTGDRGSATIEVTTGESLTDVRDRINASSHSTGVTASVSGDDLTFTSISYGSDATVAISDVDGTFNTTGTGAGTNGQATINGRVVTGVGNRYTVRDNDLVFTIEFQGGFSGGFDDVSVSGRALQFALTTDLSQTATLAVPGVQAARLAGPSGRLTDLLSGETYSGLGDNVAVAVRIVDEALGRLEQVSGVLDGFASAAIDASSSLLSGWSDHLSGAIAAIDLVDPAEEKVLLAKNEALAENVMAGLSILNDQRSSIVALIKQIAGLQ